MDVQQHKDDAAAGKLSVDRLILVIKSQQKRFAELEELIKAKNPTERLDEAYSQNAEQTRKDKERVMWRLENGRAVLVAYEVFRSGNQFGKPAGAIGRGEFGIEVIVALAYQNFTKSQKCWAHLIRKAIKLTLQEPDNATYRRFADRLLEIYNAAERQLRDDATGRSCFAHQVETRGLSPPRSPPSASEDPEVKISLLDRTILYADASPEAIPA